MTKTHISKTIGNHNHCWPYIYNNGILDLWCTWI